MIRINFSESEKEALNIGRHRHAHVHVRQKMEVLWLKSLCISHSEICKISSQSSTTVTKYLKEYIAGGIESLETLNYYRPTSDLEEHKEKLLEYFSEHPYSCTKEAKMKIEELTNVSISVERVRIFMRKLGFSPRKVGMIPAKADVEKQAAFKK